MSPGTAAEGVPILPPRRLVRGSLLAAGLTAAFLAFFNLTKHQAQLAAVNPFAVDPYDAVASFGLEAACILTALSLCRAVAAARRRPGAAERWLRTELAVALSVLIPLVADSVALLRHTPLWLGSPDGYRLAILVTALIAGAATAIWWLQRSLPAPRPFGCRRALPVVAVAVAWLTLYPEALTRTPGGELATVVAGAVFLFAPLAALLPVLAPAPALAQAAGRHRGAWWLAVVLGVVLGLVMFAGEALGEGGGGGPRAAAVASVFVGLNTVAVLIGFALLRRPLGLHR